MSVCCAPVPTPLVDPCDNLFLLLTFHRRKS
jgi:hypothetical protein